MTERQGRATDVADFDAQTPSRTSLPGPPVDERVAEAVETLWRRARGQLRSGGTLGMRDTPAAPRGGPPASEGLAVLPVFEGEELLALLYVDAIGRDRDAVELELRRLLRRLSATISSGSEERPPEDVLEAYLERTPVRDIQRQKLLLLLERHGWNIARVARLMGVTRRTVYLRLRRYGVPRQRRYKTKLRRAAS